jgi:hypothetical protein
MPAESEVTPVKRKTVALFSFVAFALLCFTAIVQSLPVRAGEADTGRSQPVIPPTVSSVRPAGLQRGTTKTFTVEGRNLAGANFILFDDHGISAKVGQVIDLPEETRKARPGVDLGAIVAEGRKQEATLEVTALGDVEPGIHRFRIETPLGTSNMGTLDVGEFPEVEPKGSPGEVSSVTLPATLVGTIAKPGHVDTYQFEGRAAEEVVFQTVASRLMSKLDSLLVLRGLAGEVLAKAGEYSRQPDSVLTFKLPSDGTYTISITDRNRQGGAAYFYRLNAGAFPYLTRAFPLGIRAGQPADIAVEGANLDGIQLVKVEPPKRADGWTTVPLRVKTPKGETLNKLQLAVGNDPEALEKEPNNTPAEAQPVTVPVTIEGRIWSERKGAPDEDYFRFHARKGEQLTMEVAAARLGSPLDSLIEVLDDQGRGIPHATVRCLNQTLLTLADRDSLSRGYRLLSTFAFHDNDYIMVGEELDQIEDIPDQPDADILLKGFGGQRVTLLGTSPQAHAVNDPVYRVQILEPGAQFPANGLPVFEISYRNDDGGPGYGADSRLEFTAPRDGDYLLHLKDVRGLEGPDCVYRLTITESLPDFQIVASPANPNVPRGGRVPLTVSADRHLGYDGPIEIEVQGLPKGLTAAPATIPAGQDSTVVILEAAADASEPEGAAPFQVIGKGRAGDRELVRTAGSQQPLKVVSLMPPPDLSVEIQPKEVTLEPGQTAKVTLRVERRNAFAGRVPCNLRNLPPGVRVVNVGLNGILIPEQETTRTFTVKAEDWARSIDQPAYLVGAVESNASTYHASPPLMIRVRPKQVARPDEAPSR